VDGRGLVSVRLVPKANFDGNQDNIWSKYQICVLEKLKEVQARRSADEHP
jgi:hypothetical protein